MMYSNVYFQEHRWEHPVFEVENTIFFFFVNSWAYKIWTNNFIQLFLTPSLTELVSKNVNFDKI